MIATTYRQPAPRRQWWARRPVRCHHDRPAEVLAVLQHAKAIVEAGWVQNRWTVTPVATAQPTGGASRGTGTADGSVRACLVAAVALAVRARDPRADLAVDTGPALAYVWDAVHGDRRVRAAGRAAPHEVRIARMRELAGWNDRPGRTRAEVVAALDRAAAGVVAQVVGTTAEPERV
jgi:hypothetical protein